MRFQVVLKVACSKGRMITLAASIDFSPLWDLKCILKSAGQVDAKLHWLHLFDFSPLQMYPQIACMRRGIVGLVRFPNPSQAGTLSK